MLRKSLVPKKPAPELVDELAEIITQIESAFEIGAATTALMKDHNRLTQRNDIEAERYEKLYTSMSSKEAALEALMPSATVVADITREELEEIAKLILEPENDCETSYYLDLFEMNTPSGNSDLFFWPDEEWLVELGTDNPSPAQIVDKAFEQTTIIL